VSQPPGRSVIVTGGSRGLGAVLVDSFLQSGDRVATCSRSGTELTDRLSADASLAGRYLFRAVDLADREASTAFVKEAIAEFGGVDVLVNNAGVAPEGVLALFSDDDADLAIDLNLKATVHTTRVVVRKMLVQGSGRIINISSVVGLSGYRGLSVYGATKAALDGFTRALARELGEKGITVNSVAPGYLRTEMTENMEAIHLDQIARRTPLGRLGEPEDVAAAVQFLASPAANFISGHVLVIDGGLTA
jgi:3-oxoacyl-[acyl-carrier protein] reductase